MATDNPAAVVMSASEIPPAKTCASPVPPYHDLRKNFNHTDSCSQKAKQWRNGGNGTQWI